MQKKSKPVVFVSYTWLTEEDENGNTHRVPDKRAESLAEKLRKFGIDSRLDLFFYHNKYGFEAPSISIKSKRDPWLIWSGEQIAASDSVILICTPNYSLSDKDLGNNLGEWYNWHLLSDEEKDEIQSEKGIKRPALWWDWHYMANEIELKASKPQKFIPVGFGPYNSDFVPGFVRGNTYYNLNLDEHFNGLLQKIKKEYRINNPRNGVFVSYAHQDEEKWLNMLIRHLNPLERKGVEIWTDKDIIVGDKWHESIQTSLSKAKIAILLVTPAFLDSEYITNHELSVALQAAENEGLIIFWIPVKPSSYRETEIAHFQAAHPPSKPLSGLRGAQLDQAFVDIISKLTTALSL